MIELPAEWSKPPPGYKPGQTRAPLIWDIAIPMSVVAVFLGCLRLYVRAFMVKVVGKDDWLLLAAVICLCVLASGVAWEAILGLGKHQYDLIIEQKANTKRLLAVCHSSFYMLLRWFSMPCR